MNKFLSALDKILLLFARKINLLHLYIINRNTKQMLQNLESLESKINLIIEQNNGLDDNEFVQILDFLPEEFSKIKNFNGKQTVLKDNYYNRRFIEILKDRSFITRDNRKQRWYSSLYQRSDNLA